jgi:hypothetical protein
MNINVRRIPNYIKAVSAQGLRRSCLRKNIRDNKEYDYKIIYTGKHFYAWFFEEVEIILNVKKDGDVEQNIEQKE